MLRIASRSEYFKKRVLDDTRVVSIGTVEMIQAIVAAGTARWILNIFRTSCFIAASLRFVWDPLSDFLQPLGLLTVYREKRKAEINSPYGGAIGISTASPFRRHLQIRINETLWLTVLNLFARFRTPGANESDSYILLIKGSVTGGPLRSSGCDHDGSTVQDGG